MPLPARPRRAAGILTAPLPVATSSNRIPEARPAGLGARSAGAVCEGVTNSSYPAAICDLAVNDAEDNHRRERYLFPSRRHVSKISIVSAAEGQPQRYLSPFGDLVLNSKAYVWEGSADHGSPLFDALGAM